MAIRTLSNGKYRVDVLDKNGLRIRKNFDKLIEAKALSAKIEKEKTEERLVNNKLIRRKICFEEAIAEAKKSKSKLAPKSFAKYKSVYYSFEKFVQSKGLVNLSDFTTDHADDFRNILINSGAAPKTINFYLLTVKAIFNEYVARDILVKSPFNHVKLEPKIEKSLLEKEDEYYSKEDIKNFFKQSMSDEHRHYFLGLFFTGMRCEELHSLRWERIDWENKLIQVRKDLLFTPKTNSSERDIPMSEKLHKLLKEMKSTSVSEYVFTFGNKKVSERKALTICKAIAERSGIKKNATLHKWRHSFTSHLAQMKVDYAVREYLMGHKPQSMTDHYTKLDPKTLHSDVNKLDALIP